MQLFSVGATIFKKKYLFWPWEVEKTPSKVVFSLLPWAAQTAQIEEFIFQNVAYRPTVCKTGDAMQWGKVLFTFCTRVLYRSSHDHHRAFVCLPFIHFISLLNYLFYTSLCGVSSVPFLGRFLIHLHTRMATQLVII